MKKQFIFLALTVFCSFALSSSVFANEWQTYTNENYGFSIEYPSNMRSPNSDAKDHLVFWEGDVDKWVILIEKFNKDRFDQLNRPLVDGRILQEESIINIDGKKAKKFVYIKKDNLVWHGISVVFSNDKNIYYISNGATSDPSFERFYGSFKWLEEPTTQSSTQSTESLSSAIIVSSVSSESSQSSLPSSSSSEVTIEPSPVTPQPWYVRFWQWVLSWF